MKFCPECENILYPTSKKKGKYLVCKFCGYEKKINNKKDFLEEDYRIAEDLVHQNEIEIMEEEDLLPKVPIQCSKCNNSFAFRREKYSDDGEIVLIFKCTKCKHVWMETD